MFSFNVLAHAFINLIMKLCGHNETRIDCARVRVCVCVCVRERERERERERKRETDRERQTERDRQRERENKIDFGNIEIHDTLSGLFAFLIKRLTLSDRRDKFAMETLNHFL